MLANMGLNPILGGFHYAINKNVSQLERQLRPSSNILAALIMQL